MQLTELLHEVASDARGHAPATIVMLSGDVHHAYLAKASFRHGEARKSGIYQAVCSPLRNALSSSERRAMRFAWSAPMALVAKALARAAGVQPPILDWRLMHDEPWFGNQIATLEMRGRSARFRIEKPALDEAGEPVLKEVFESALDSPV